MKNSAVLVAY